MELKVSDTRRAHVTVAVSTLGRPAALARCIRGILGGNTLPAEIVIVDQSTDVRTACVVEEAGRDRLVPLRYVRQLRRGLAASRNGAVAYSSEPILVFTDDDCVPDRGWLTAIVAAFEADDHIDVVTGRILPLGPDRPGLHAVSTRLSRTRAIYRGRSLPWAAGSGGNIAMKRAWWERLRGFDERLGAGSRGLSAEDMDFLYRLLRGGATVCYEPDAVVFHQQKDEAGWVATRRTYGFGMGVFCGLWLRSGDPYASWILARWSFDRSTQLLAALVRGRRNRVRDELLMLRSAISGVGYGLLLAPTHARGACAAWEGEAA
jgi:GT2 family glycosyltransferase